MRQTQCPEKLLESVCNQPAVMQGFTNTADCSVTVSGSMQQQLQCWISRTNVEGPCWELPPVDVSWGSWHAKAGGGCYRPVFHWGDFSTSVWDIKLFFKGAWLCWGTLTTWLGSRGSAFLHGGGGGQEPCGTESPCKWTSSYLPTGSGSESQKSAETHENTSDDIKM